MAGRKPRPSHLKVLTGNPGHRRLPTNEPLVVEPLGEPPSDWPAKAKQLWWEVQSQIPPGVATRSDRQIVELTVRLIGKVRVQKGAALTPSMAAQIRACLACLGMTPADRARLTVAPRIPGEDQEIEQLFGEK